MIAFVELSDPKTLLDKRKPGRWCSKLYLPVGPSSSAVQGERRFRSPRRPTPERKRLPDDAGPCPSCRDGHRSLRSGGTCIRCSWVCADAAVSRLLVCKEAKADGEARRLRDPRPAPVGGPVRWPPCPPPPGPTPSARPRFANWPGAYLPACTCSPSFGRWLAASATRAAATTAGCA